MLTLGVNTSGDVCEAALLRDGEQIAACAEPMGQGHDRRLAPMIKGMLAEANVSIRRVSLVAVVVGPGSFTGVRIGAAFARGLALALDAQAVGVTTLEACLGARALRRDEGGIAAALPAKRRPPERTWWAQPLAFAQAFDPIEADEAELLRILEGASALWGDDLAPLDALAPNLPRVAAKPSAKLAGEFAYELLLCGMPLPPATPVYVREPDAAPMRPPFAPAPSSGLR